MIRARVKFADFYACCPGNSGEQADAIQAYTQCPMANVETWITLSRDLWLPAWKINIIDPVFV